MTQVAYARIVRERDLVQELEAIVDRHGLLHVLTGLENMCHEKAEFVNSAESIGQPDKTLAKAWTKCANACRAAAVKVSTIPLY